MDIGRWLRGLGLGQYERSFLENEIDGDVLPKLTAEDLKELGVHALGHRRKILVALQDLNDTPRHTRGDLPPISEAGTAERRQLTVMFCDLVGSTALSTQRDPEDMSALLRAVHGAIGAAAVRYDGHLAKLMGDGALVYFGYPRAHEDDAERAVRAGLAAIEAIRTIGRERGFTLETRVGIATGLVVVGELMGEGEARERGVVGETPNLAARLQALAPPGSIAISLATRRLLGQVFHLEDLGPQHIKGLPDPAPTWLVVRENDNISRFQTIRAAAITPFVGRDSEVSLLVDRWRNADLGEGQVVLLSGEAGIGKSRILSALQECIDNERPMILRFQCSPHHANEAFYPIIGQIWGEVGGAAGDRIGRLGKLEAMIAALGLKLEDAVPSLAALLTISTDGRYPPLEIGPSDLRERIVATLVSLIAARTKVAPVLILLEDAHWIDPTTLDFFDRLVDVIIHLRLLMVVTFRPEFSSPWLGRAHVTAHGLNRFGRRHALAMIERVTGGKALPSEVLEEIMTKTDGVPLFVEELTKAVLESGQLRDDGDVYTLTKPLSPGMIPSTLQDSLMARLDRIGSVKQIAQIGAAIGREFSYRLLEAVSPLKGESLQNAIRQLVASELIFERGAASTKSYVFKHALVQDTAYASLLRSRRQTIHAEIARALVERFADEVDSVPAIIAHHYTEAGLIEPAARYWLASSEWALARSANAEADRYVETALGLIPRIPEGPNRQSLELSLQIAGANALSPLRGYAEPRTMAALTAAKRLLDEGHGSDLQRLSVLTGLCSAYFIAARMEEALALAREIVEVSHREADNTYRLVGLRCLASVLYFMGKIREALEVTIEGLPLRDPLGHRQISFRVIGDPSVQILCYRHLTLLTLGLVGDALQVRQDVVDELVGHPHATTIASSTYMAVTWNIFLYEEFEASKGAIADLVSYCTDMRIEHFRLIGLVMKTCVDALLHSGDETIAVFREALSAYNRSGSKIWNSVFLARLAEALLLADKLQDAEAALSDAFSFVKKSGERYWLADLHRVEGLLALKRAEPDRDRAESCFLRGLDVAGEQEARLLQLRLATELASLWQDVGSQSNPAGLLKPILAAIKGGERCRDVQRASAFLAYLNVE